MNLRELGLSIKRTCEAVGIDESLYYKWLKLGQRQKKGKYFQFFQASLSADAKAQARKLLHIEKAAEKGSVSAATWFLEHRFPDEFKQSTDMNVSVKPSIQYLQDFLDAEVKNKKGKTMSKLVGVVTQKTMETQPPAQDSIVDETEEDDLDEDDNEEEDEQQ